MQILVLGAYLLLPEEGFCTQFRTLLTSDTVLYI